MQSHRHIHAFALLLALSAAARAADSGPAPPCGGSPTPAYPAVDAAPVVRVWNRAEWTPPPCTGWQAATGSTVVATAARLHVSGGVDGLRRKVGAVSEMKGLRYWSTSSQKWQPYILDAAALDGAGGGRRKDFAIEEIAPGRDLYIEQQDNVFGKGTFRLRIVEATPSRLVFATENRSMFKVLGLTVADAGEIQSICFLDRDAGDVWRYYAMARTGQAASVLAGGFQPSLINRAVAVFRYLAGIPGDKEPPAAR